MKFGQLIEFNMRNIAKWSGETSVLNYVPRVPLYHTRLTCLCALRTHVPYVPSCLSFVSALPFFYAPYVPSFFYVHYVPSFFYVPYMPSFFYVPSFFYMFTFLFMHMLIIIKLTQINELTFDCTSLLLLNSVIYHSCHILYFFFFLKRKILITFNAEESTWPFERLEPLFGARNSGNDKIFYKKA